MSDAGACAHHSPAQASAYKPPAPQTDSAAGKLKAIMQQQTADRSRKAAAKNANA